MEMLTIEQYEDLHYSGVILRGVYGYADVSAEAGADTYEYYYDGEASGMIFPAEEGLGYSVRAYGAVGDITVYSSIADAAAALESMVRLVEKMDY